MKKWMRSSYEDKDVMVLLKDISGQLEPLGTKERERRIQSGVHYSEMLPLEYRPTQEYIALFEEALRLHAKEIADAVACVAEKIWMAKGQKVALISLARAGTPIGILIKRYLEHKYGVSVAHYTISIIRGRGMDHNAMAFVLERHSKDEIQFVDGWTGKGAIAKELNKEMEKYDGISSDLAVLADPAGVTNLFGTKEDFLIPSACLNATVSGLLSRTVLNKELISSDDFHGAVYYDQLEEEDRSMDFIHAIETFLYRKRDETWIRSHVMRNEQVLGVGLKEAEKIGRNFEVQDINFIKPGIGETTRVVLRRVPWKVLVKDKKDEIHIGHILRLCHEKKIEVVEYPLEVYRACGIIKNVTADV